MLSSILRTEARTKWYCKPSIPAVKYYYGFIFHNMGHMGTLKGHCNMDKHNYWGLFLVISLFLFFPLNAGNKRSHLVQSLRGCWRFKDIWNVLEAQTLLIWDSKLQLKPMPDSQCLNNELLSGFLEFGERNHHLKCHTKLVWAYESTGAYFHWGCL